MIPVYNCAVYLVETLAAVLQQAGPEGEMQIEVVDDCSTDVDVEALVRNIGHGRVKYFRQEQNVGSLRNFETCINRARGYLVHILHGDDLVKPGYYASMENLFDRYPSIGAAFCRYVYVGQSGKPLYYRDAEMEEAGILDNWLARVAGRQRLQFCTVTVKREVYEQLGGFYGVDYGEDWEMWVRIARHYPVAYDPTVLAAYRLHMASISGQSYATAKNLKDLQWVIRTIQQYLPDEEKDILFREAMKFYAHYGIKIANDLWYGLHSRQGAKIQVREALSMHRDAQLYWKITKLYIKMALNITSFIPRTKQRYN
ncbi:glycosyltransferase [Paraflavitalea soli]|uniref:Glycosyltransferase n=2 Tax=Paraflavitalea soli TaxID=2315862 RepID=A0A3B7MQY3_9BACT|nr:glycosyltransferase [Paraflavitalea soli]